MQLIGRAGAGAFSLFVDVPIHVFHMRAMSWMLVLLTPIAGMVLDVAGKVYSNMFFPTQTQIHVEIFNKEKAKAKKGDGRGDMDDLKLSVQHSDV